MESVIQRDSAVSPSFLGFGAKVVKAAYVWKQDTLNEIVRELDDWQSRFDPTWFLVMTIANPIIDRANARGPETTQLGYGQQKSPGIGCGYT